MTPQERQLVTELFDRLAALEKAPRDPDAERAIAEGLGRAPNAVYALVQTAIVQDEALKRADARIAELEGQPDEPPHQGGFLDSMREALLGRDEQHGSVPSVRQAPGAAPASAPVWGSGPPPGPSAYGQPPAYGQPSAYGQPGMAGPIGSGGSFLGTAAASAAGVIGGSMLLSGIRSMFGHSASGASAYDPGRASGTMDSPWGGSAGNSDLARQAGIDHIGGSGRADDRDTGSDRAGLFGGNDQNDNDDDDDDNNGDDSDLAGDFGDDDSDNA
jgi:hypothetical protein